MPHPVFLDIGIVLVSECKGGLIQAKDLVWENVHEKM